MSICGSHGAHPDLTPRAISNYAQVTPFTHKLYRPFLEDPKKMTSRFAIPTFSPAAAQHSSAELLYSLRLPDAGREILRKRLFKFSDKY